MRCPRCDHAPFNPYAACPTCEFQAEPERLEALSHLRWLLDEIGGWPQLDPAAAQALRRQYEDRLERLEIELGLRPPPLSPAEIETAWRDLRHRQQLLDRLESWSDQGWLHPDPHQRLATQVQAQIDELRRQIGDHRSPLDPAAPAERLALNDFLHEGLAFLETEGAFVSTEIHQEILAQLEAERERLQVELGLREPAPPEAEPIAPAPEPAAPPPAPPPPPARPRREPITWDRVWRTLLSERTLQAILFLGTFFIFVSATTLIVFNWSAFPPYVQLSFIAGFTAAFYAFGWYVRTQMKLYRSGIALSAIASLLVPFDFYAIYLGSGSPAEWRDAVWLGASLFCLLAYLLTTAIIRDEVFGYLVGVAAGSALLAGLQLLGLPVDLRTGAVSGLALGLTLLAAPLSRAGPPWRPLAPPFRQLALLTAAVLMPLTFGFRYLTRPTFDLLHVAVVINWAVGGILFALGAVRHRSRSLGLLAAGTLPVAVYLAQDYLFAAYDISAAWHGLGLALLTPLYFWYGRRLQTGAAAADPILRAHGRTATGWGVALLVAAALWSPFDLSHGTAAAISHAVLSLSVLLATILWNRPWYLFGASFLALSATAFGLSALNFPLPQVTLGWALLAVLHLVAGLRTASRPNFARPLYLAGFAIAALAIFPPLLGLQPGSDQYWLHWRLLVYGLGNWLLLATWGAILAHRNQPGFPTARAPWTLTAASRGDPLFHWLVALPLPAWVWLAYVGPGGPDRAAGHPDGWLAALFAGLAWGLVLLARRLKPVVRAYHWPWYLAGLGLSALAALVALPRGWVPDRAFLGAVLISAGALYLAVAWLFGQRWWLVAGGLTLPLGSNLLLDRLGLAFDPRGTALALLPAAYLLGGVFFRWRARRRGQPTAPVQTFFLPLHLAAHLLTLVVLWWAYVRVFDRLFFDVPWSDEAKLWAAGGQLLLGAVYALVAWDRQEERWGHVAAWLGVLGGGLLALAFSTGSGISAALAALLAIVYVLAERLLHRLPPPLRRQTSRRARARLRLAWRLYRRPLLVAGWSVSGDTILLALIRNLLILEGRRPEIWAIVALLAITGLYALSARLFRRPGFLWLAAPLLFAPWTLLTHLGWFTVYRPTVPGYALSWVILAWLLLGLGLWLDGPGRPLRWTAHVLLPFALLWGIGNVDTGRFTMGLAVGFYALAAAADHRRFGAGRQPGRVARFLYPALGLVPVWAVYLLAWLAPAARHEHYGLLLLAFVPPGLLAGVWLKRLHPADALPAYLTGYACAAAGTMLVAHDRPLLIGALLYDALVALVSAWLFRQPLWVYPATALAPLALLLALAENGLPPERRGWWLIGLGAVYLVLAALLRRSRLGAYATPPLAASFALISLGLPASSRDRVGAFWGYGAAALLYAAAGIWLRQALLLTPAAALIVVPYAVALRNSSLAPAFYGLMLWPGALLALAAAFVVDRRRGRPGGFPWDRPGAWPVAVADRLLGWWALPLYALGFGLAAASPLFTENQAHWRALNLAGLMLIFAWAAVRFRLRGWLLLSALAGQLAAVSTLVWIEWWPHGDWAAWGFLPVTLATAALGLYFEHRYREGSPFAASRWLAGWSRPLYALAAVDVVVFQIRGLALTLPATGVTAGHALLLAVLASRWTAPALAYGSTALIWLALFQGLSTRRDLPPTGLPPYFALLAWLYGLGGYALILLRRSLDAAYELRPAAAMWSGVLRRAAHVVAVVTLLITAALGLDVAGWLVRALFGFPFRQIVELNTVLMVVGVLAILSLFYLLVAVTNRRLVLGYLAVGMMLVAWSLYLFFVRALENVQWYAIPAGLYLLGVSYLEWQQARTDPRRALARWLDYAAMVLMMGTAFWQSLTTPWVYAALLSAEGLGLFWWGSARRLRRILYAGVVGVILAVLGQFVQSLLTVNRWVVFGVAGLILVTLAIVIERRLETVLAKSREWRERLEAWE